MVLYQFCYSSYKRTTTEMKTYKLNASKHKKEALALAECRCRGLFNI